MQVCLLKQHQLRHQHQHRQCGGNKLDLTQRNRFVGIKSQQFGTVKFGKYDTYLKLAQGKIDLFNDFAADMEFTIAGENRIFVTLKRLW